MRDTPFNDVFEFLTGQTGDQMGIGGLRWFTVALYWALAVAGVAVAVAVWRRDPSQRTPRHLAIFAMRFVAAEMWYLGTLWKLPLPVSGAFQGWLENTVKFSAFDWHAAFMQVFVDHIAVAQPLVYLLEVFLTASLMLGFAVRLSGVLAALFTFNLLIGLYNDPTEWPWTYIGIIFTYVQFAMFDAGRSLGLDHLLRLVPLPALSGNGPVARAWRLAS